MNIEQRYPHNFDNKDIIVMLPAAKEICSSIVSSPSPHAKSSTIQGSCKHPSCRINSWSYTHLASFPCEPKPSLYFGFSMRSGTTGVISNTAFNRSLTTWSCPVLPASLISFILVSASLFASSSAFLLPLVCYRRRIQQIFAC